MSHLQQVARGARALLAPAGKTIAGVATAVGVVFAFALGGVALLGLGWLASAWLAMLGFIGLGLALWLWECMGACAAAGEPEGEPTAPLRPRRRQVPRALQISAPALGEPVLPANVIRLPLDRRRQHE
jgi:hypothetical protein